MNRNKLNTSKIATILTYVALVIFMLWVLIPFYVIIANAITPANEFLNTTNFIAIPSKLSFESFIEIFNPPQDLQASNLVNGVSLILTGYWNMIWQTVPKAIISLFASGLTAYAYCKLRFPGKNLFFNIQIATMMLPLGALTIPSYLFYADLGWVGESGILALVVPGLFAGAGTIFFLRQYFEGIPNEIVEAARVDGLGEVGIFFKIMLPLAMPAFVAQFILGFIGGYNSYTGPLLYLSGAKELYPLQLVFTDAFNYGYNDTVKSALVVFSLIPILLIYLFGQKFFIGGITAGAVKG